jgi:hypothetical protein
VNVWLLWPRLAVHACFSIGAGLLTGMAELTRPTVPAPTPAWLADDLLAEFVSHKWDDVEFPRERL